MIRRSVFTGFLVAFLSLLSGCGQPPSIEPSGRVIKIGIVAPFTGSDFAKGQEGLKGVKTVLKMQPLLANGDRIEIVAEDDRNDPATSVKKLQKVVETDNVSAVLTFSGSDSALALSNVADRYRTPILAALATHPDVPKTSQFVSQVCFDNKFQGKVAAMFVRDELLVDKVAVFQNPANPYSTNLAAEFNRMFTQLEGEVTDLIDLTDEQASVTTILNRAREMGPELLYLPISAPDVIDIIEALHEMNWKPKLMASDGLLATIFSQYEDQIDLLDGLLETDFFHHASRGTPFAERVKRVHGDRKTSYAAMGIEGFAVLLDAMNRCEDSTDKACINQMIRTTTGFEGLLGQISIDRHGKAHRPVVVNAIQNGRLENIVKVY